MKAMFIVLIVLVAIIGGGISMIIKGQLWEECRKNHSFGYCYSAMFL